LTDSPLAAGVQEIGDALLEALSADAVGASNEVVLHALRHRDTQRILSLAGSARSIGDFAAEFAMMLSAARFLEVALLGQLVTLGANPTEVIADAVADATGMAG
jgi:predicted transcriptional regulator YheO